MALLSRDEVRALIEKRGEPCISIFLPTHRAAREKREDPIKLKNLLREAESRLLEAGTPSRITRELLAPPAKLVDDNFFWLHQSDGLALFCARDVYRYYQLPLRFEELAVVAQRFHIKPLMPLLTGDGPFHVLAISQNQVRLLEGTRYTVSQVELKDVPGSLDEALRFDERERHVQYHTPTPVRTGTEHAAMFHGHGEGVDDFKVSISRFFHQVDHGVSRALMDLGTPLVLAAVDFLHPIYRQANTYPHLLEQGLMGNPDGASAEELRGRAWAVIEPYFLKAREEAIARFRGLLGTGLASRQLEEVVPAAYRGRVEVLFVATGIQQWGRFDPDTEQVALHPVAEPGAEDLLDLAAVHTFLNSGTVYALPPDKMPDQTPAAAIFRY